MIQLNAQLVIYLADVFDPCSGLLKRGHTEQPFFGDVDGAE